MIIRVWKWEYLALSSKYKFSIFFQFEYLEQSAYIAQSPHLMKSAQSVPSALVVHPETMQTLSVYP